MRVPLRDVPVGATFTWAGDAYERGVAVDAYARAFDVKWLDAPGGPRLVTGFIENTVVDYDPLAAELQEIFG